MPSQEFSSYAGFDIIREMVMRGLASVFCALLLCALAPAQKGGWRIVENLAAGSPVKIQLRRGASASGNTATVSATGLVLEESNGLSRTIAKNQITKVYLMGKAHKLRDGLIGAGVGGIGGFIYGAIIATRDAPPPGYTPPGYVCCQKHWVLAGSIIGGALGISGAIAGFFMDMRHTRALIYERDDARRHHKQIQHQRRTPALN